MVLYHANGRVVIQHEHYLEQQARRHAHQNRYEEQIDVYNGRNAPASVNDVRIIIDKQNFRTLYCQSGESYGSRWENLERFNTDQDEEIQIDIDRNTLRLCSNLADEHFRFKPGDDRIHLPIKVPRRHAFGMISTQPKFHDQYEDLHIPPLDKRLIDNFDPQMAYIRSREIVDYIIPWLKRVQEREERYKKKEGKKKQGATSETSGRKIYDPRPILELQMELPDNLESKLHLYNAMVQLGLPYFIKEPLIKDIVLDMYTSPLNQCHLDILEMTIGRLNSRSMAILDPVFSHFIGTYAFRSLQERQNPGPYTSLNHPRKRNKGARDPGYDPTDFRTTNRQLLAYSEIHAGRPRFPADTEILPPELPVIGHSIKHWAGLRPNGGTAAAHTGYPLNVGKSKKFVRRNSREGIDVNDFVEIKGNLLVGEHAYRRPPGRQGASVNAAQPGNPVLPSGTAPPTSIAPPKTSVPLATPAPPAGTEPPTNPSGEQDG